MFFSKTTERESEAALLEFGKLLTANHKLHGFMIFGKKTTSYIIIEDLDLELGGLVQEIILKNDIRPYLSKGITQEIIKWSKMTIEDRKTNCICLTIKKNKINFEGMVIG